MLERRVRFLVTRGLVAAVFLASAGCKDASSISASPPRPIYWAEVEASEPAVRRVLPGLVRPARHADLAFEVGGRVENVAVEVGDTFRKGDVLARLEARTLRLTRDARASAVAEAEATLREAKRQYDRKAHLHGDGWASGATYDTARAAVETARSRLENARARLALAREDLDDAVLRAPYDGAVARRMVEPAQQVSAGQIVFDIQGRGDALEISVPVPETLVMHLARGDAVSAELPALDLPPLAAVVTDIGTDAARDGTYPVTLRLDSPPKSLRAGMTAAVTVTINESAPRAADPSASLTIPASAFLMGQGSDAVAFVVKSAGDRADGSGVLERRAIVLGPVTSTHATVRAGLSPGEIVAVRGLPFLRAGQPVIRLGIGANRYE